VNRQSSGEKAFLVEFYRASPFMLQPRLTIDDSRFTPKKRNPAETAQARERFSPDNVRAARQTPDRRATLQVAPTNVAQPT
jgi:hypothetical protein